MSEGVLVDCPECKRPALKRLISASAFRLKGSGWYETDFKQDNKRNLADSAGKETSSKVSAGDDSKKADKTSKADNKSTDSSVKQAEAKPAVKSVSKEPKNA
jgi:hypothetical protein